MLQDRPVAGGAAEVAVEGAVVGLCVPDDALGVDGDGGALLQAHAVQKVQLQVTLFAAVAADPGFFLISGCLSWLDLKM